MKALVLAGGFPQIDLIQKLRHRGIETILADYYEHPVARDYADVFYRISTLDVPAIKQLAIDEAVDFLITVCTDQSLLTVAQVSDELGLPCYIDYQTALNVTNKDYMKKVFTEADIPTARHCVLRKGEFGFGELRYPLIVKPVDCNSSKGVRKVYDFDSFKTALINATEMSRTDTAIVEEYISGKELSVDVYVNDGKAIILDITTSEKIKDDEKFVIFRTWHPADITNHIRERINIVAQQIADAFGLRNAPMLIQMIDAGEDVYVLEFSARTGGGVKHLSILRRTNVDVVDAVIDLTLGNKPEISMSSSSERFMLDEYIYCSPGEYDHLEGFSELKENGTILDYYVFRSTGSTFDKVENSGDRLAGFTIVADSVEELAEKHNHLNNFCKVISTDGSDIMRHDILGYFNF